MATYVHIDEEFTDPHPDPHSFPRFSCRAHFAVIKAFFIFGITFAFSISLIFGLKFLFSESVKLVIIH